MENFLALIKTLLFSLVLVLFSLVMVLFLIFLGVLT